MLFDPIQASRSLAVINVQKNSSVQSAEAHENKLADTAAKSATSHKVTEIFLTKTSSISSLPPVFYLHQRLAKGQASSPEVERGTWIRNGCSFSSLKNLWIGPQMTTPFSLIASNHHPILPNSLQKEILTFIHSLSHQNTKKLSNEKNSIFGIPLLLLPIGYTKYVKIFP